MKPSLILPTLACFVVSAAFAQDLSWADFAQRPEVWPAQCTLRRSLKFKSETVSAGQSFDVLAVKANQVELATASGVAFAAKPDDTDALTRGNVVWKKLTPKQRELTYAKLLQRKDLWPYRVKLTQGANLGNVQIPAGREVIVHSAEPPQLLVVAEKEDTLFDVTPKDTDILQHAWKALEDPSSVSGRYAAELNGKLVNARTGAFTKLSSPEPRYYAFYRGASWCGPCRQFSPSLVKFYNHVKPAHPEFELILISDDAKAVDMYKYAKEEGFTWPAVPATFYPKLKVINPLFGKTIPQLVVTDASGKVLVDSDRVGREPALKQLEALLNQHASKNAQSL